MSWRSNKKEPWRAVQEPWEARNPIYHCPKCGKCIDSLVDRVAGHYHHIVLREIASKKVWTFGGFCIGVAFTTILWLVL